MNAAMKALILSLGLTLGSAAAAPVTLTALFMKQAAYSEADIQSMVKAFEARTPAGSSATKPSITAPTTPRPST